MRERKQGRENESKGKGRRRGGEIRTGISSLLNRMAIRALRKEEWIVWETEKEGRLLLDLPHAMLNRRGVGVRDWVEVQRDDRDAVGELLCGYGGVDG